MKLNILETHDRLQHLQKDQALNISQGAQDCLKKNSLSLALQQYSNYIYIFAHARTADDGVTKRMLWQPRLTRPIPQTNSFLFRAQSKTDNVEICWLLPPRETISQFEKGKVTENELVIWSYDKFDNDRLALSTSPQDDLDDETIKKIYVRVERELREQQKMEDNSKLLTLGAS